MATTTLWVLLSLTMWMGQELVVDAVNAYSTAAECRAALRLRAAEVATLPHCCGGGAHLRCIPWPERLALSPPHRTLHGGKQAAGPAVGTASAMDPPSATMAVFSCFLARAPNHGVLLVRCTYAE
jgi:hypothetical protein